MVTNTSDRSCNCGNNYGVLDSGGSLHRVACRTEEEVTPAIIYDNTTGIFSVVFAGFSNHSLNLFAKHFDSNFDPVNITPLQPPLPNLPDPWQANVTTEPTDEADPSIVLHNNIFFVAYASDSKELFVNAYTKEWNQLAHFSLTSNPSFLENDPSLFFYNGSFYIAYESFETENWHIFLRQYNVSFGLQTQKQLTFSANGEQFPSLIAANNRFYVAYSCIYKNDAFSSVFLDMYDGNFKRIKSVRATNGNHSIQPSLCYANNSVFMDYMVYEGGNYNIVSRQYDQNLSFVKEVQVTGTSSNEATPRMVYVSDRFYHVYTTDEYGGNDIQVSECSPDACVFPDLTVNSIDYTNDTITGEILGLNVSVQNKGYLNAPTVNVSLYIDESYSSSDVIDLPKGSIKNIFFNYTTLEGIHQLKVVIDPLNEVSEENEENNELAFKYWALIIPLVTGQNLVSIPVRMKNTSSQWVLRTILDNLNITFTQIARNQSDPWKSFDLHAPPFANDLTTITNDMGLWITVNKSDTLQVGGVLDEKPYDLIVGWNLVGYPFNSTRLVTDVQSSSILRHRNYTTIFEYNASLGYQRFYEPGNESSNLTTMSPGLGYWVYVPDTDQDLLSDGEEVYEFYRELFLESEDFINSKDVDKYQFGTVLRSTLNPQNSPWYYLNFNITKDDHYRITTSGTGEVEFMWNLYSGSPPCDFDWNEQAKNVILALLNISVKNSPGKLVNATYENKSWVHIVSVGDNKKQISDLWRVVTVQSYWTYTGEFDLKQGTYTVNMSNKPIPGFPVWRVNTSNGYFRIERQGLNSLDNDTDHDTIIDGVEFYNELYPLNTDPDRDGLSDPVEFYDTNTNTEYRDTDFDGVRDSIELGMNGTDVDNLTIYDTDPKNTDLNTSTTTDPVNVDTDHDGLPDGWTDGWNYTISSGFDVVPQGWLFVDLPDNKLNVPTPLHGRYEGEDFDGDGMVDQGAWNNGITFGSGETDPLCNDTDNDTLPDAWEAYWRINPLVSSGANGPTGDVDVIGFDQQGEIPNLDGLTNIQEFIARTSPRDADSDDDGLTDGAEVTGATTGSILVAEGFEQWPLSGWSILDLGQPGSPTWTQTSIPHSGLYAAGVTTYPGYLFEEWLVTDQIDLSEVVSPTLSFWWAGLYNPTNCYFQIKASINGGKTPDDFTIDLYNIHPYPSAWKQVQVPLLELMGESEVHLAFFYEGYETYPSLFLLDDINLTIAGTPSQGGVIFRTNVPNGTRTIDQYGTVNASGAEEWVWFNDSKYVLDRIEGTKYRNFSVLTNGDDKFLALQDVKNITVIVLLDDNTLISLNTSRNEISVWKRDRYLYKPPVPDAQNNSPQLAFKNREVYLTDPLQRDTDKDAISDSDEPRGDYDSDGVVSARDYDSDNDNIPDWMENTIILGSVRWFIATDTDGDGSLNMVDLDSDADGILDTDENPMEGSNTSYVDPDTDDDGLLDGYNLTIANSSQNPEYYKVVFFLSEDIHYTDNPGNQTCTFWGEKSIGTLPNNVDTDSDRLWDGFNRLVKIGNTTRINNYGEFSYGANPLNNDTDGDTVIDGAEVLGWPVFYEEVGGNRRSRGTHSDPTKTDTDGDEISDANEYLWTAANITDTDGDGLPDGVEDYNKNGIVDPGETNPVDIDSDDDLLPDGKRDLNENGTIDPGEYEDRDGDRIVDLDETNPVKADTDNDGLIDGLEIRVVRLRTSVQNGNYSSVGAWVALDVGAKSLITFLPYPGVNRSLYTWTKLSYKTPEQYEIYYNLTGLGGGKSLLWIKTPQTNYTLKRSFATPQKPLPTGEYATREVYFRIGANPRNSDTDNDGVTDGDELYNLSRFDKKYLLLFDPDNDGRININDSDSDNDQILDGNDLWHTTNKTIAKYYTPENASYWERFWWNDYDGDGKPNALDTDSDGDNITDTEEDGPGHSGKREPGEADPLGNDSDEDGLLDNIEGVWGLSYTDPDYDNDGIKDGYETGWNDDYDEDSYINARDPDSDGDGLLDGINKTIQKSDTVNFTYYALTHHVSYVNLTTTVIFLGEGSFHTNPWYEDTDYDGVWDGFDPTDVGTKTYTGKLTIDTVTLDIEGIRDSEFYNEIISTLPLHIYGELSHGTDPRNNDTDHDGITDGNELNGYFLYDSLWEYKAGEPTIFINTPADYILQFRTEAGALNIGGGRRFTATITDIDGYTPYVYSKVYEERIFFRETEYYPYKPGIPTADGIPTIYYHNFQLNNLSAGPKTIAYTIDQNSIFNPPLLLMRGGLNPLSSDSDSDGLTDTQEVFGTTTVIHHHWGNQKIDVTTIATKDDSDADDLNDSMDALPADMADRVNLDWDLDGVWDNIDLQPNTEVNINWETYHLPTMIRYDSIFRIWGIGGSGCGDILGPLKRAALSDCPSRFGQKCDALGKTCWKKLNGFFTSEINDKSVKDAVTNDATAEDPFVIKSISRIDEDDPAIRAYPNPYNIYNGLTYYPAWKLYFELPWYLYDIELENEKPAEVKINDVAVRYNLSTVKITPETYQEFVIQFGLYMDYFYFFDSDNFYLPAISFTLYDTAGVAKENILYRGIALAQPLESPTLKSAYQARIKIPKENATTDTMQLYISPIVIMKGNGDIEKAPITHVDVASLSKQTIDYTYSVITYNETNLTQIVSAVPDNVHTQSSGLKTFGDFDFYIYHHDGSSSVDYSQINMINTSLPSLDGVILISYAPGMVDVITSKIDWTSKWYIQDPYGIKAYRQYKKEQRRIVTFDDIDQLGDPFTVIQEPIMESAAGDVASQIRRLDNHPINSSFETGFTIQKKEEGMTTAEHIDFYLSTAKNFIEVGTNFTEKLDAVLELAKLKDSWYETAQKYQDNIEKFSDAAEFAGDMLEYGSCLATDGVEAYTAAREGDAIKATLYSIKVGVKTYETAHSIYEKVKVTEDVEIDEATKVSSDLGKKTDVYKSAKGLKAGLKECAVEIIIGVVDIGLQYLDAQAQDDPIARKFAYEALAASCIDLALSVAGTFFPPLKIITATFDVATELFAAISPCETQLGCNLGKKSLSEKIVFFWEIGIGEIPADVYQEGFRFAQVELFGGDYDAGGGYAYSSLGYLTFYSEDWFLKQEGEDYYAQAVVMPKT